jgi:hypothetical protein
MFHRQRLHPATEIRQISHGRSRVQSANRERAELAGY